MNRFLPALLAFVLTTQVWAQSDDSGSDSDVKMVKVSQKKFQAAVVKALVEGKADFYGILSCEERCGNEPGETDYNSKGELYSYSLPKSKRGGFVAGITAEKNPIFLQKYFVLPLSSCNGFFKDLRAARKPVIVGEAPYRLTVEYGKISMNEHHYDFMKQLCQPGLNTGGGSGQNISFQSIVGPIVNIDGWISDESEYRSKNSFVAKWISWNLEENRRAELTDLFEKDSVLKALKADKVMRQRFFKGRTKALEQATELAPLMKAIEADPRQYNERMGWQILSYDSKKKTANVHIGFFGDCCNSTKVFRIGLDLKVKSEFEALFELSKKRGWLDLVAQSKKINKSADFERALNTYTKSLEPVSD